jgi:hypothetical protein
LLPDNAPAHHTFVKGYADPRVMNIKKPGKTTFTESGWFIDANGKRVEQVRNERGGSGVGCAHLHQR